MGAFKDAFTARFMPNSRRQATESARVSASTADALLTMLKEYVPTNGDVLEFDIIRAAEEAAVIQAMSDPKIMATYNIWQDAEVRTKYYASIKTLEFT
jgi:hypothetical protein